MLAVNGVGVITVVADATAGVVAAAAVAAIGAVTAVAQ